MSERVLKAVSDRMAGRCPYCETPYSEGYEGECWCVLARSAALRAEVKRLREALQRIIEVPGFDDVALPEMVSIARNALDG